jgi:hypothetical protein
MWKPFEYPDHTKPWRSQTEMSEALSDPRYSTDEYFRRACESKFALGYELNAGPQISGTFEQRYTVTDLDHKNSRQELALKTDRDQLQLEYEALELAAFTSKNPSDYADIKATPFASREEMQRAMSHEAYRNGNEAYRRHVEQRTLLSNFDDFQITLGHKPNS